MCEKREDRNGFFKEFKDDSGCSIAPYRETLCIMHLAVEVRELIIQIVQPDIDPFYIPITVLGWTLLCGLLYYAVRAKLGDDHQRLRLATCFLIFISWLAPAVFLLFYLALVSPMEIAGWFNPLMILLFLQLILTVRDMVSQFHRLRA